jgi:hypothetical protein
VWHQTHYQFGLVYGALNNISVISWQSVLLVEETGVPGENHRPIASNWQTLSHNVVSSTPRQSRVWTHVTNKNNNVSIEGFDVHYCPIRLAVILVIMSVSTFESAVILNLSTSKIHLHLIFHPYELWYSQLLFPKLNPLTEIWQKHFHC